MKDPEDFQAVMNDRIQKDRERLEAIKEAEAKREASVKPAAAPENNGKPYAPVLHPGSAPATAPAPAPAAGKSFDIWWESVGQGICPAPGEQTEDWVKRVARMAWNEADLPF